MKQTKNDKAVSWKPSSIPDGFKEIKISEVPIGTEVMLPPGTKAIWDYSAGGSGATLQEIMFVWQKVKIERQNASSTRIKGALTPESEFYRVKPDTLVFMKMHESESITVKDEPKKAEKIDIFLNNLEDDIKKAIAEIKRSTTLRYIKNAIDLELSEIEKLPREQRARMLSGWHLAEFDSIYLQMMADSDAETEILKVKNYLAGNHNILEVPPMEMYNLLKVSNSNLCKFEPFRLIGLTKPNQKATVFELYILFLMINMKNDEIHNIMHWIADVQKPVISL